MNLYSRAAAMVAATFLALGAFAQNTVTVTTHLNSGSPDLSDVYIFLAQYPGGTTNAIGNGPYSASNGSSFTVPNPDVFGANFEYVVMGEYTDLNGLTHVALGTGNDLTGQSWAGLFGGYPKFTESAVATDLASGAMGVSNELASFILSYYISGVNPVGSYSTSPLT